jgi:hypothetical protein
VVHSRGRFRGDYLGAGVAVAVRDPVQELAERVADGWSVKDTSMLAPDVWCKERRAYLVTLIANELRAGGWVDKASHEKALAEQWESAADFAIGRNRLAEIREDPTRLIKWADLEAGTASAGTNVEIKP